MRAGPDPGRRRRRRPHRRQRRRRQQNRHLQRRHPRQRARHPVLRRRPLVHHRPRHPDRRRHPHRRAPAVEVTHHGGKQLTPNGVGICNPAFDVTPAKYITAIITERGVLRAPYAESLSEMELARLAAEKGKTAGDVPQGLRLLTHFASFAARLNSLKRRFWPIQMPGAKAAYFYWLNAGVETPASLRKGEMPSNFTKL